MKKEIEDTKQRVKGSFFGAGEVKLTEGIFKTSQDLGKKYLLSLDPDRLLAPVAHSTGAQYRAPFYGGWEAYQYRSYRGNGISGHSLGHYMSALSAMYAGTEDREIKERLDYIIDKLEEYQQCDGTGYIGGVEKDRLVSDLRNGIVEASGFELNSYWVPWYSFHKIYQGLIDAHIWTGNKKALPIAESFAQWAIDVTQNLNDEMFSKMLNCEYGGMNDVFAQLYEITGKDKYCQMAKKFCQETILSPLSKGVDNLEGLHANTQIPKIIGAAKIYEQNSERKDYKRAAEFFYDTVVNHRSYVIGGNSNYEHFGGVAEEVLGPQTLETCNTHNMLKLTEHLFSWEHKGEYMDYYERALFNHILASQDRETGEKTYFMATNPGHFKVYSDALNGNSFWCCVGSGMENPGRYTRNIYYKDGNELYVNQFISSKLIWKEKNTVISQSTNFPYEDETTLKIEKGGGMADIKIRIPSWIDGSAAVTVNGDSQNVTTPGYHTVSRRWEEGDRIKVKLPMKLHTYISKDNAHKVAYMYGPIALAGRFGRENFPERDRVDDHTSLDKHTPFKVPHIIVKDNEIESFIKIKNKDKLEFTLTNIDNRKITLIPYADLHHERYALYWRQYMEGEEIDDDKLNQKLNEITIDSVRPYEQQSEIDHNMQKSNSHCGYYAPAGRGWRDARGKDGYVCYDLEVDQSRGTNYVMSLYWGEDAAFEEKGIKYKREFEIYADGVRIGEGNLTGGKGNDLFRVFYKLPENIIAGKKKVRIKFAPKGENCAAGRIFEIRITYDKI